MFLCLLPVGAFGSHCQAHDLLMLLRLNKQKHLHLYKQKHLPQTTSAKDDLYTKTTSLLRACYNLIWNIVPILTTTTYPLAIRKCQGCHKVVTWWSQGSIVTRLLQACYKIPRLSQVLSQGCFKLVTTTRSPRLCLPLAITHESFQLAVKLTNIV